MKQVGNMKLTNICNDRDQASRALADHLAQVLKKAINERGRASLVVSGGTSPVKLFEYLRNVDLDWTKVTVVPSDERLVPADSPERNERMVKDIFLKDRASRAHLVSLVSDPDSPAECEKFANDNMANFEGSFDAVVLGMGDDGHTASLFPDSKTIEDALASELSCCVQEVPSQERIRISLTPKALLNSRELVLLVFGESKHQVLQTAGEQGPVSQYPVRVALHQNRVPLSTYWAP